MATLATIALFPPYSLDTSILVAVLIGVVLLALFTETLGWVFVGLVVPGYLASVFVIHPEAGVTIVIEAILTYWLARLLSRSLSLTGAWSEFFGRERFFLVVLASVLVRLVCEVWLLPHISQRLDAELGTSFSLDRTLYSIGLVLVPLTANAFWKLEVRRGLIQVGVPVALTYLVLRFVLLPSTNLSFSTLELTYEDVAQNFLASPKTYIILLTTAFLAARFNLLYGWDFNGVLVPALIALTWFTPGKLLATFAEVLMLVFAVRALLSLPGMRTLNLEGPRKIVLVFFVGFALKWMIGWVAAGRIPGLKVTDLFGFGYLVPTLLAVKILQKQVMGRILFATLHTSLAGFLVGSLIGFGLGLLEPRPASALAAGAQKEPPRPVLFDEPLGVMAYARATAREVETEDQPLPRRRGQLRRYAQLWTAIDGWLESDADVDEMRVRRIGAELGMELHRITSDPEGAPERYVLVESPERVLKVGWDTAVLTPGASGPILEVPRPASEAPAAEAAWLLCEKISCRAVIVSGVDTRRSGSTRGDVVNEPRTPLGGAREALNHRLRVELRTDSTVSAGKPVLHVAIDMPLRWRTELFVGVRLSRASPPDADRRWGAPNGVTLRVNPDDLYALVTQAGPRLAPELHRTQLASFLAGRHPPAPLGRKAEPPSAGELIVLQRQVARVLLGAHQDVDSDELPPEAVRVAWATRMAALLGLTVTPVTDGDAIGPEWLVLDRTPWRGAGAGLLVRASGHPLALEVPGTTQEPGTLPFALELWHQSNARALLFADPGTVQSGEHAAAPRRVHTGFQAMHQALQRSLVGDALVLQIRGFGLRPGIQEDAIISLDPGLGSEVSPKRLRELLAPEGALSWLASSLRFHDGAPELVRLLNASPQQAFSRTFGGAPVATLWLSDHLRGSYLPATRAEALLALTGLANLPLPPGSAVRSVSLPALEAPRAPPSRLLEEHFQTLLRTAERFISQQDVESLRALGRTDRGVETTVEARWSTPHGLPYLVLQARQGRDILRAVTFLHQHETESPRVELLAGAVDLGEASERALRRRRTVVIFGLGQEEAGR